MRCLAIAILLLGCGGSEPPKKEGSAPAKPAGAAAAPAAGAGSGSGKPLVMPRTIEWSDQIGCPAPEETGKPCDPKVLRPVILDAKAKPDPNDKSCPEGSYCLPTTKGPLCGACPERDTIRAELKERDYAPESNRDPFQPYIIKIAGAGSGSGELPRDTTSRCAKQDQLRIQNFGFQSLKLVGIVSQGTQRRVLLMDPGNRGHIIRRGDCVGKEKAWVRDIGENFICFEAQADQAAAGARPPESLCMELHTKQLTVDSLPTEAPAGPPTNAPVIAPPPPPGRPGAGSGVPVIVPPAK